jgi:hypothetical protein
VNDGSMSARGGAYSISVEDRKPPALLVVRARLPERLPHALRDPAMRLAVQDHRVDRAPAVVHARVARRIHQQRGKFRAANKAERGGGWQSS